MKDRFTYTYRVFKQDLTLTLLTLSAVLGYLLIFLLSRLFFNMSIKIPSFITYIFIVNTILSIAVVVKDRFAARLLMSFNLIIELISIIAMIKSSVLR
ncbi:MAG: hypothetical protein Q7S37_05370 [bacterium]|nr:hypothetical protein [bacterium]